jgi:energy-coupling factor transporter ATP-binding protein EcfA2
MTEKNRIIDSDFNYGEFVIIKNHNGLPKSARLECLNQIAIQQIRILTADARMKRLEGSDG